MNYEPKERSHTPAEAERQMTGYRAMAIVTGMVINASERDCTDAYQYLIDTGYIWTMPGSYGRAAQHLIDEGYCSV